MIWLTWRQFRGQFLVTLALLAAATAYLLYAGYTLRHAYNTDILGCLPANGCKRTDAAAQYLHQYTTYVTAPSVAMMAVPAVLGIFWGTPLVARELETNTHRLVWNQSITRTRWLATKLSITALAAIAVTAALSLLLTWAASRYDQLQGTRFEPLYFASRNIAPLGYAAFAFALGTTVGLLLRRTVPAMAVTLLIIGAAQIALPAIARPYLAPVTETVAYDTAARTDNGGLRISKDKPVVVLGYTVPGALMVTYAADLETATGEKVYTAQIQDCLANSGQTDDGSSLSDCVGHRNLHFTATYQPAGRYWNFQWLEFGTFGALALLLSGVLFWRIRHVTG